MSDVNKKLKLEIPDSPFDRVSDRFEPVSDDDMEDIQDYFDDPDERLTDEELDMLINYQFEGLEWKKERKFDDLMKEGHPHTQRGFYCYVISQMSDEQLQPHINNYVEWLERMNYKKELNKLPKEVRQDDVVMDLKKRRIDDEGKRLGRQVGEDLMSLLTQINGEDDVQ